jgi:hypothetical protein
LICQITARRVKAIKLIAVRAYIYWATAIFSRKKGNYWTVWTRYGIELGTMGCKRCVQQQMGAKGASAASAKKKRAQARFFSMLQNLIPD